MTDLVKRLRMMITMFPMDPRNRACIEESADEIERLKKVNVKAFIDAYYEWERK